MDTLKSYVSGRWHEASEADGFASPREPLHRGTDRPGSSAGVDFGAVMSHARDRGGPALRELTFAERGALLKAMSKALRAHRDELLDLSRRNNGTTVPDGSFDVDGASGTLAYYAAPSPRGLGERRGT